MNAWIQTLCIFTLAIITMGPKTLRALRSFVHQTSRAVNNSNLEIITSIVLTQSHKPRVGDLHTFKMGGLSLYKVLPTTAALILIFEQVICHGRSYTLCIPEDEVQTPRHATYRLHWINGRDKLDCLYQVMWGKADITLADPALLHLTATYFKGNFSVIGTIRDAEMKFEDYASKIVAVIKGSWTGNYQHKMHKKGLCVDGQHAATWHFPVSMMYNTSKIDLACPGSRSTLEEEASAVRDYFGSICTVNIHKQKHSTSYANCPHCMESTCNPRPSWTDPMDCLMGNGGGVAFTTLHDIHSFFYKNGGYNHGMHFACPDDTLQPLSTSSPCIWGAQPWEVILAKEDAQCSMSDLQLHGECDPGNLICQIRPGHEAVPLNPPLSTLNYISTVPGFQTSYQSSSCRPAVRFCIDSVTALVKCEHISIAAKSLHIHPTIECVSASETLACIDKLASNKADFAVLDALVFSNFKKLRNLQRIMAAPQLSTGTLTSLALAVVSNKSGIHTTSDLFDKNSCHSGFRTSAGWWYPLYHLIQKDVGSFQNLARCSDVKWASHFFHSGCATGLQSPLVDTSGHNPDKLCNKCPERLVAPKLWHSRFREPPLCNTPVFGETTRHLDRVALNCMIDNGGIAFVSGEALFWQLDWKDAEPFKTERKRRGIRRIYADNWSPLTQNPSEYLLLCPDSTTQPLDKLPFDCHWGQIPWPQVVTTRDTVDQVQQDIIRVLWEVNELMGDNATGVLYKFIGHPDITAHVIFNDFTSHLEPVGRSRDGVWDAFVEIQQAFEHCFDKILPQPGSAATLRPCQLFIFTAFVTIHTGINIL